MKITFLNPSASLGGAERVLLGVLESLREAAPDWELHLVTTGTGPLVSRAGDLGVTVEVVELPARLLRLSDSTARSSLRRLLDSLVSAGRALAAVGDLVAYSRRLREVLRRMEPDVVHTNGFKMHLLGGWCAPRGAAVVWHVHDYVGARPLMSRLLRLSRGRCGAVVANSASVGADVQGVLPGVPVSVVHNAVDLEAFNPVGPSLDLDRLSGLAPPPEGVVRVGLVATMGWWKGHEVFLRALAESRWSGRLRAYVVGGPVYETAARQIRIADLRQLARDLGLENRVGFPGFLADTPAVMRALDVVVHASTAPEPFGLVIAEAMASGRAMIMSSAGGAAEIVEVEVDALAHEPGDAYGLARAIDRLIEDPELRRQLGENARRAAELRFDRARLATQLMPTYTALAADRC